MHIDMDCFFVSVGLRNHPELKGKPVAITHAKSGVISNADPNRQASRAREFELYQERLPEGATSRVVDLTDKIDGLASMSEIASCSYEARQRGIKNGMFLGQAVQLCPELKTLPYDFEGYKEVSHALYNTVASYTLDIEAVSCDEMYVDVTQILNDTGLTVEEWAIHIRNEIVDITRCPCSTGFGANRLQARLATKKAKPAGQYYLKPDDVEIYMSDILVADLPGVGRATLAKLRNLGLNTCGDLQRSSLKVLQSELGIKLGKKIYNQAFGRDNKALEFDHERKSVSAEINYGIRFKTKEECYSFLQSLSNEVFNRLNDIKMRARNLTLKLLIRAEGAPVETAKFLGHGVCDAISKSSNSNLLYTNPEIIYREAKIIYDRLNIPFSELRGVGIQLTKLEKIMPTNKAMANFLKQTTVAKKSTSDSDKIGVDEYQGSSSKDTENLEKNKNSTLIDNTMPDDSKIIDVKSDKPSSKKINTNFSKPVKSPIKTVSAKSRGRPKGSTSSRSRISPNGNTSIKHFLQKGDKSSSSQVEETNKERELEAKLLEQIDMTVLNELPEEIRLEVLQEYGITSTKFNTIKNNTVVTVKMKTSEKNSEEKRTASSGHSPFTNLTWEQTKAGIKAWVKSENIPSAVDVDMLGDHLRQLALDRKLEVLQTGFNFLYRTFSTLDCAWHQAYFSIVNNVQQGMVARYGKTLYLVTAFHCCQIH
ncbi:DNA repair protein REV1-like [Sitophilus oryzae]|uniref:DNA repair protein REV1 n=1 Tax=Sitophilus oryzae TaxID=7048 RepID=A0A6J2YQP1_SITOR|nr:DNA repair protein REV1-like [Sitophilus oryzae]